MKKQIYRKESFPSMYIWEDKICFMLYWHNSKQATYEMYNNITGEVFGNIIVTETNTGSFNFSCSFNSYLYMDDMEFIVIDTQRGFDYIAKNIYNKL